MEASFQKTEIKDRSDIMRLITIFYEKVQKDEQLGPIFNPMIAHWPKHLEHIADFWESNLLGIRKFVGNPMMAHAKVDSFHNYEITQDHFARWLQLWIETLEAHFYGSNAVMAKNKAAKMATFLFINIVQQREHKGIFKSI